jgi:subtilisin family serine protease
LNMKIAVSIFLLFVVAVSAELAPLLRGNPDDIVNGSYIVILKEGSNRDAHVQSLKASMLAAADGSQVGFLYHIGSFIGFSAQLSDKLLRQELSQADVKYIEADQVVSINYKKEQKPLLADIITQHGATWGLDRVDQRTGPLNGTFTYDSIAGAGVDVYVIDTGIYLEHNDFGGRATFAYSSITGEANTDLNGHGTHCAGTIGGTLYGVAKNVNLKTVKVLNAGGSGTFAGVISGINYVSNNQDPNAKGSIGSMSLGGGATQTVDDAVVASVAAGVAYSIAAGNSNANACNYSPARVNVDGSATVGATANTDARATYSNIGTCVDIFAPGTSITSDWIGSPTATYTISGTSMATPHVAGALAVFFSVQETRATPADATAFLYAKSTPNVVTNPGTGSPNRFLYAPPNPTDK